MRGSGALYAQPGPSLFLSAQGTYRTAPLSAEVGHVFDSAISERIIAPSRLLPR